MFTLPARVATSLCAAICALLMSGSAEPSAGSKAVAWLWDGAAVPAWSTEEVAVVVGHYLLQGDSLMFRPRMRAPVLRPGTRVTPVVHVELSTVRPPTSVAGREQRRIEAVVDAARYSTSGRVQLDMEARPSHREFYLRLVKELRAALPRKIALSVTALAWWCRGEDWMNDLAADEVVPMFFRMGRGDREFRRLLRESPESLHPRCTRGSAGFSVQEAFGKSVSRHYARTYWFDYRHWRDQAQGDPS